MEHLSPSPPAASAVRSIPPPLAGLEDPVASASPRALFIDQQLTRTRRYVKLVDLAVALLRLTTGLLVYVLAMVIVDHWLMGLNDITRFVAWFLLWIGVIAWLALRLIPLLLRRVNPVYAALAIERSQHSLKNSLVNYLMLRGLREHLRPAVFDAVENRASVDLKAVDMDAVVDRTQVIQLGYALVIVVAVLGLYKIFSPKDPFQTVARVAAPWQDIATPAVVQISEIIPGDTEVYFGQELVVSVVTQGLKDDQQVNVEWSSEDGQLRDQRLLMTREPNYPRYRGTLSPAHQGIRQRMIYRIVAGDAVTRWYHIAVRAAPNIQVDEVTYEYPPYTRQVPVTVKGDGNLRAVEGTRVTVRASANVPMQKAFVEFDPRVEGTPLSAATLADNGVTLPKRWTPMLVSSQDPQRAEVKFMLELAADQQSSAMSHYQLRFMGSDGTRNPMPIVHGIDVIRDLAPLIEIIAPRQTEISLAWDDQLVLETRAHDPDFGLTMVQLSLAADDVEIRTPEFREVWEPAEMGQHTASFRIRPADLRTTDDSPVRVGQSVRVTGVATDNRRSPDGTPNANSAQSQPLVIHIGPPRQRSVKSDPGNDPNGNGEKNGGVGESAGQGQEGQGQEGQGQEGQGQEGQDQEGQDQEGQGQEGQGQEGQGEEGQGQEGQGQEGQGQGGQGQGADQPNSSLSADKTTSDGASPTGAKSGQQSEGGGESVKATPHDHPNRNPKRNPVPSDGTNDGEAFERVLEHIKNQPQQGKEAPRGNGAKAREAQGTSRAPEGQRDVAADETAAQPDVSETASEGGAKRGRPVGQAGEGSASDGAKGKSTDEEPLPGETPGSSDAVAGDDASPARGDEAGGAASSSDGDGKPVRGTSTGPGPARPTESAADDPGPDEANVEYARQATNLVLDYLQQQEEPDPTLLRDLGWTDAEMRQFVERWRHLEREAVRDTDRGRGARRELEDALQSLGLRPRSQATRRAVGQDDQVEGVREGGERTRPPAEYRDWYDAYRKGLGVPKSPSASRSRATPSP